MSREQFEAEFLYRRAEDVLNSRSGVLLKNACQLVERRGEFRLPHSKRLQLDDLGRRQLVVLLFRKQSLFVLEALRIGVAATRAHETGGSVVVADIKGAAV